MSTVTISLHRAVYPHRNWIWSVGTELTFKQDSLFTQMLPLCSPRPNLSLNSMCEHMHPPVTTPWKPEREWSKVVVRASIVLLCKITKPLLIHWLLWERPHWMEVVNRKFEALIHPLLFIVCGQLWDVCSQPVPRTASSWRNEPCPFLRQSSLGGKSTFLPKKITENKLTDEQQPLFSMWYRGSTM